MQGLAKQSDKYMVQEVTTPRIELPSAFQVGWEVCLQFGDGEIIRSCWVTKVLFSRSKVFYDIEIAVRVKGNIQSMTRIHCVDSAFIKPFDYGKILWYHRSDHPDTESLVECRYIGSSASDSVGPNFFARFKFDGNGFEWFDEQGTPICDAVQFEWTEIKTVSTTKDRTKEQDILKQVEEMCIESLAPDEYEDWNKILNIIRTRRHHA
jgi:hypothetical protein